MQKISPHELEQVKTVEYLPNGAIRKTIRNRVLCIVEKDGHTYKIMDDCGVKKDGEFIRGDEAEEILHYMEDFGC